MKSNHYIFLGAVFLMALFVVSSCTSCSSNSYRGFVPVSRDEAELFAEQFVTDLNNGNKEKLFAASTDSDAHCANYFFRGLDIPPHIRNTTKESRTIYIESVTNTNVSIFKKTGRADFLSCEEDGKMYAILVKFDIITAFDNDIADKICRLTLLKKEKTGDIIIVRHGFVNDND